MLKIFSCVDTDNGLMVMAAIVQHFMTSRSILLVFWHIYSLLGELFPPISTTVQFKFDVV